MNILFFFKKIFGAFGSADIYKHVGTAETSNTGLKYLLLLVSIFWIPDMIKLQVSINNAIEREPIYVQNLPTITIKNGIASFDKPSPYILKLEKNEGVIIFDTTGRFCSLDTLNALMLVTQKNMIYKKNDTETRVFSFSQINDFTLTHEKIYSWSECGHYFSILAYIIVIICAFIYRSIQALLFSLVGLIFQSILKTNFSFQTIYRLTILSITPAFVLDKFLDFFDLTFTGWSMACLIMSLIFLYRGLKTNIIQNESI